MKKRLLLSVFALGLFCVGASATDITASVTSNTTWSAAGSPYIIVNNIEVSPGITLTIENGVVVKFNSGRYLHVRGTLNATGVSFTGNAGVTKGFWDGIYVSYEYYGNETGNVNLNNCTVEYASNLYVRKGNLTLNNCLVNNLSGSVRISNLGELNIDNTTISNTNYPITYYGAGVINPGANLVFSNNTNNYVDIDFADFSEAWRLKNFGLPYYNDNNIYLNEGASWTIDPGVNLSLKHARIEVRAGKLKALGTKDNPIIFDKYPTSSYWYGLWFNDGTNDTATVVRNCVFQNASYDYEWYPAMRIINASVSVDSCVFRNNAFNLSIEGESKPTISNTTFKPTNIVNQMARNITMDMNANPIFINDSLQFNASEIRAMRLRGTTVTGNDAKLKKLSFIDIENISYCLYDNTIVHDTAKLMIDPGVVVKWRDNGAALTGNGRITAVGTDAEPIVFTHIADDSFGNPLDSQNDGTQTVGNSSGGRIYLNSNAESRLEKCKILYGGYNQSYFSVNIKNANVVNNCEIKYSHNGVQFTQNSVVTNNSFTNIPGYTIGYVLSTGSPNLEGNTVSNIGYKGILLYSNSANDSPTLKKMNFAGYTNLPFILTTPFVVNQNNTVSIDPGVVIKSHNFYNQGILVNGALKAVGTKSEKIVFTSIKDDSAWGDSNNDGTGSIPGSNDWRGLSFSGTSNDNENILKNCEIRYSGDSYVDGVYTTAPLAFSSCKVVVDSVKINFSAQCGVCILGDANPEIKNTAFWNIAWEPIVMDMFANPKFDENNTLANVANIAIKLRPGTVNGVVPKRNFAGFNPITYAWWDDALTVSSHLTIPAGLTFKGYGRWNITGKLSILGTAENPVVFTTVEDDAYGIPKDTQQNGQASYSQNGNYFVFYDASNDSSLIENAIFRYAYQVPLQLNNASPTIKNCKFESFNKNAISMVGNCSPAIENNLFNNVSYPFSTSILSYPASTVGNVIAGTTGRGIRINDETLSQDAVLSKRSFAGINNIPYIFRNYTIGSAAKLEINPGVILKFEDNGYMNVRNGLKSIGGTTADSLIVFTSVNDDFYGGDTFNNGSAAQPGNVSWQGIYFYNESIDNDCNLTNNIIRFGSYYDNRGAVTVDNASPTILDCRFEKGYHGIMALNTSLPSIINCDFIDVEPNYGYAVWNKNSATTLTATNCYFNSNTGPRHASNPTGTGTRVSDYVSFTPFGTQLGKAELGDVSTNGAITAYDASLILQHAVSNITLGASQLKVADVSRNGAVSSYDASMVLQYNVGLIYTFSPNPLMVKRRAADVLASNLSFGELDYSGGKGEFVVPVRINSAAGVKSIDLQLDFNPQHIGIAKVEGVGLRNDIYFLNTNNASDGHLKLSLASAYDLNLNNGLLYLSFKLKNEAIEQSSIVISNALFNEEFSHAAVEPVVVKSRVVTDLATNFTDKPYITSVENDNIIIELSEELDRKDVRIVVYDMVGRIIYQKLHASTNVVRIPFAELNQPLQGVCLMQINVGNRNYAEKIQFKQK